MGFKLAPQFLGLVRGEPKAGQKHRANGKAIAGEMGEERVTSSVTYDEDRSHLNEYEVREGLTASGFQCWDDMKKRADDYRIEGVSRDGSKHYHGLRKDAVIGVGMIINPPEDVCTGWDDATYQKLYDDTWDFLEKKEPRIFRKENIVMTAKHNDEGYDVSGRSKHEHMLLDAIDQNGKYCGNLIDAKFLATVNKEYPKFMRSRGWEIDDLDTTDWKKYKEDSEYRAERKAKAKKSGMSLNKYLKQKSADTAKEEAADLEQIADYVEQATEMAQDAQNRLDGVIERENAVYKREQALKERERALEQREHDVNLREMDLNSRETLQNDRERILVEKANNLAVEQKKVLKEKLDIKERKKKQEKREADFQVKEDAQEAQKMALDEREKRVELRERAEDKREAENSAKIANGEKYARERANRQTTTAYDNSLQESTGYSRRLPGE